MTAPRQPTRGGRPLLSPDGPCDREVPVYLTERQLSALDAWCATREPPVTRSAGVRWLLTRELRERGELGGE